MKKLQLDELSFYEFKTIYTYYSKLWLCNFNYTEEFFIIIVLPSVQSPDCIFINVSLYANSIHFKLYFNWWLCVYQYILTLPSTPSEIKHLITIIILTSPIFWFSATVEDEPYLESSHKKSCLLIHQGWFSSSYLPFYNENSNNTRKHSK